MEEINFEELNKIPIPEELEKHLSMKIDEWEAKEKRSSRGNRIKTALNIAAGLIIVFGMGVYIYNKESVNPARTDTYKDPRLAYKEAENAIELLADNLNRGMEQYNNVNEKGKQAEETLYKQINVLK